MPFPIPGQHHGHHPYGVPYPMPIMQGPASPGMGMPMQSQQPVDPRQLHLYRRCGHKALGTVRGGRSNLNAGKVLCNKCGLFERTHNRSRPEAFPHKRAPVPGGGSPRVQPYPPPSPQQPSPSSSAPGQHQQHQQQQHQAYIPPPPLPPPHSASAAAQAAAQQQQGQQVYLPPIAHLVPGANGHGHGQQESATPVKKEGKEGKGKGRGRPKGSKNKESAGGASSSAAAADPASAGGPDGTDATPRAKRERKKSASPKKLPVLAVEREGPEELDEFGGDGDADGDGGDDDGDDGEWDGGILRDTYLAYRRYVLCVPCVPALRPLRILPTYVPYVPASLA
ncbi:hypothetical protein C8F01DRAFT_1231143 [Mycena amicta]|nr:hypothetical protein C8F01DRAFT_1231143 [Mycena amicta]